MLYTNWGTLSGTKEQLVVLFFIYKPGTFLGHNVGKLGKNPRVYSGTISQTQELPHQLGTFTQTITPFQGPRNLFFQESTFPSWGICAWTLESLELRNPEVLFFFTNPKTFQGLENLFRNPECFVAIQELRNLYQNSICRSLSSTDGETGTEKHGGRQAEK